MMVTAISVFEEFFLLISQIFEVAVVATQNGYYKWYKEGLAFQAFQNCQQAFLRSP